MPTFLVTADTDLTAGKPKRLVAWHLADSAAAACVVLLRNGSVSGPIYARINLASGTSASQSYAQPGGWLFESGLFVDVVSGTIVGSVTLE